MSPVGLGTESATPVWAGPQLPGRIPSKPGMSGRGIATRRDRRVRAPPVERSIDLMGDSGEGTLAPADDALVHLEPAAHRHLDRSPRGQLEGVAGQRLADRRHPADRQVRRPSFDRIAPGVAEMGDDEVAGGPRRPQVHDDLAVEQEPPPLGRGASELEGQTPKDLAPRRQPPDRLEIGRVEPRTELDLARVAMPPQVHGGRQGCRPRRRHGPRAGGDSRSALPPATTLRDNVR